MTSLSRDIPKVVIIILNWNGWKDTIECIESLFQTNYDHYDIIIIDNDSSDGSINYIKEYSKGNINIKSKYLERNLNKQFVIRELDERTALQQRTVSDEINVNNKDVILIRCSINHGFSIGNNLGINYALKNMNPDYILLLNNDVVVDPNFLTELIKVSKNSDNIGLLSPMIYDYYSSLLQYSPEKINWYTGLMSNKFDFRNGVFESDAVCGASMLIPKKIIDNFNLLPIEYFMLWEDVDYTTKIKRNGFLCGYVPNSIIWHKGSVSIGNLSNPIRIKYSMRNKIKFWKKYSTNKQFLCFILFFILVHAPFILMKEGIKSKNKIKYLKYFLSGIKEGITTM